REPLLELLASKTFTDFPSASAIEIYQQQLFVFGDDAPYLLVLDTNFQKCDTIRFFPDTAQRIAREIKPDIEAATIVSNSQTNFLYALGSLSDTNRKKLFIFPLNRLRAFTTMDLEPFKRNIGSLEEINIEGSAAVKNKLVFANRANRLHPVNYLIVTDTAHWLTNNAPARIVPVQLDKNSKLMGISGLFYIAGQDMLLFTASEEDTPSATQDGTIGNSYLGIIRQASRQIEKQAITPETVIPLTEADKLFHKQKVESVCAASASDKEILLYVTADNDNGQSTLFKLRLKLR
ncbi:MAG: hypothetical protein M3342_07390, partial [Bacteroidota bacterium]|nr:hypothetical protein [Bacteroidota bacterium]